MTGKAKSPVLNDEDKTKRDDLVTEASVESFPASDSPAWISIRVGRAIPFQPESASLEWWRKRKLKAPRQ